MQALASLKATPARAARKPEWEKVVMRFRRVVARYPQSGYCDNALLAIGDLYREMGRRFEAGYSDDAVQAYRVLVAEYPSSSLGEKALFNVVEIERAGGDRKEIAQAAREYLDAFPDSPRAAEVKAAVKKGGRAQEAALPTPPPRGLAQVFNLRFWSGASSTRVVLDVEKAVHYKYDRISNPDRLWVDLEGTRLHPNLLGKMFPVGDGLLEKIRIGQNKDTTVRVVLDFKDVKDHTIFYLENPTRLVVDVRGAGAPPAPMIAGRPAPTVVATNASPEPFDLPPDRTVPPRLSAWSRPGKPAASPLPVRQVDGLEVPRLLPPPVPDPVIRPSAAPFEGPPPRRTAAAASPTPAPWPSATPAPRDTRDSRAARADTETAPAPPQVNRAGSYSLARQLGLGARKIVIDAGHGGHDPGTLGRGGLQEKDLVLDVAVRLQRLVRDELGAEVVMTRSTDVFIPLEERTAIANAQGADLFLSIHANSSRNSSVRGIETYFLNFAQDPHAEAVAARENAISPATLKDLQNLVKAIALNSKIDESRDFASSVQEAMVQTIRPIAPDVSDRGVRTAPFYVLIGANMPSILAEIAFVSNPQEERLLRTPEHRDRIARSLLDGVRAYLDSLGRSRTRQLTGPSTRSTVASGGNRR
ncbi:MAG TPA: N-acetylmuramoyl-L-alanine amidase [Vicinamibacteria bacterium]|nr:N-acetylmuramoyl-L-alanine amidase [Vicinamibacteria bacterium]